MPKKPFWETNPKRDKPEAPAGATAIAPIAPPLAPPTATATAPRTSARSRSYADLLDRLYSQFDQLATDIETSDQPVHQKADALSKLARTLPLIQAAESAAKTKARGKEVTALTDAELEAEVQRALARGTGNTASNPNSPLAPQASALVPAPSQNKKNRSEALPTVPYTTDDES